MVQEFAPKNDLATELHVIESDALEEWCTAQSASTCRWIETSGFTASLGSALIVPDGEGGALMALAGYGTAAKRARGRFHLAGVAAKLPAGDYRLVADLSQDALNEEALGWLLGGYRFDRYHGKSVKYARLVAPEGVGAERLQVIAAGECLTRDLINTPTNDMGPAELEAACVDLVARHKSRGGAQIEVIRGEALLEQNFPMIHAVGRASAQAPRLIDMRWGDSGPTLTLVGKGVCFDTGGLNIKPGASMGLMKKDMGGAAAVLGLAHMIMALDLGVRLRVLIPAVENSISADAFRPGDILMSRLGLTVEINNTDAEGRLVLADALAFGAEEAPDMMLSMATLTGAARVAVGADIAPFFTDDAQVAGCLAQASVQERDPLWQLPFWEPYEAQIEPGIADLDNAPKGGFAGCITAALFLRRFTEGAQRYAHFDIYGHQPAAAPARPKGGVGQGTRALLAALPDILGFEVG